MKRVLASALSAAVLLALLCACSDTGSRNTVIPSDPAEGTQSVQPTQTPLPTPTPEPSAEPSAEPAWDPAEETHHAEPTQHPEETHHVEPSHHPEENHHGAAASTPTPAPPPTPTPAPTPEPAPAPTPEPVPEVSDIDFEGFFNALSGKYGFPENMEHLGIDVANNFYPGLADLDLDQCAYYIPMTTGGANVTEIVFVQAANSSDASAAAAILQDRIDRQLGPGSMLYPQDRVAWTDYSRIRINGNFVMLVVNANCDAIVADFNALF